MTMIVRRTSRRRRDGSASLRAGTAVAALILSSCSAIGLQEESDAESQTASVGQPLRLGASPANDWVDQVAPITVLETAVADYRAPPLLLAPTEPANPAPPVEIAGADTVPPIWSGVLLNITTLEPSAPAETGTDAPLPLLLADGSYHWPASSGPAVPAETPCIRDNGAHLAHVDCAEWTDQIALAPSVVDDSLLADQRGGFITVGGFQVDIGITVETLVNGVTQLTTSLTLDDVIDGQLDGIQIGQVTVANGDAGTDIIHNVGLDNVNTIISNSQDDVNISTLATLAIDVIDLRLPQVGNSFGATGRMSPELQQSIIRGIGP